MFKFWSFPDISACKIAESYFTKVNPHFIVGRTHAMGMAWKAYVQYIEPVTKIGRCITYLNPRQAKEVKTNLIKNGIFAAYHVIRRGEDAVIINLIDYKINLDTLLSGNLYGKLALANYAKNWFITEFRINNERDNFPLAPSYMEDIYWDYLYFLAKKNIPLRKKKIVGWEGGFFTWYALAQSLDKNKIDFQSTAHPKITSPSEIQYPINNIDNIIYFVAESLRQFDIEINDWLTEDRAFIRTVLKASRLPQYGECIKNPRYRYWLYENVYSYREALGEQRDVDFNYVPYTSKCEECHERISPHEIDALIEIGESGPFKICHRCKYEVDENASKSSLKVNAIDAGFYEQDRLDIFDTIDKLDLINLISIISRKPNLKNICNSDGWTPLHILAAQGESTLGIHVEMTAALLRFGADPNCKNSLGLTPIHLVALNGSKESMPIADLLFRYGANVLATSDDGFTNWEVLWQNGQEIYDLFKKHALHAIRAR